MGTLFTRVSAAACNRHVSVVDVNSVAVFKKRLDKFWVDQNVMFDWTADITGTGDRLQYIVESD